MSSIVKKDILKYFGVYLVLLLFAYFSQLIYLSSIYSFSSQWAYDMWSKTWWVPIPVTFAFLFVYFLVDNYLSITYLENDLIVRLLILGVLAVVLGAIIYQLTPSVSSSTSSNQSECYNTLTKNLPKNSSGHYGDSGCQLSYDAKVEVFSADVVKEDKDVIRDGVKGSSFTVKNRRITSDADSIDTWPRGTANGTAIYEDQGEWKIFLPYVGDSSVKGDHYVDNFVVDSDKLIRYEFGRVTAQPNRMSSFCYKNLKYESDFGFTDINGFRNPSSDERTVEYKVIGTCIGDSNVAFELR
jgi:hypothetical protein